ncbi:MAG: OmcA/MtrC family decaheme c-type cytochrome, partial [Shewanella sp.]|nr:OmcA/MtrC family decaheme c-type cytochrome [Shewanella sp.]
RCHSDNYGHAWAPKLIMHGSKRYAIENCQMCHTSYAGDPETGAPIDMGYMIHKIHKSEYFMVGYGGSVHDYQDVTFPADIYDCRTCHIEGETAPADAANFRYHRALACGSCHSDSSDPAVIKSEMHEKYQPDHACSTCHADQGQEGAGHHMTDAIAKDNAKTSYSASLVPGSVSIASGMLNFDVEFTDSALTSAVMSPDADARISLSNLYLGFGNEIDFGSGTQKVDLRSMTPTSVSNGVYRYTTATSLTPDASQAATGVVSTKMCVDRDSLMGVICGTGTDESINPAVITGELVAFNLNGDTNVMARRVVISNDTCANCHDEKFIGKFGIGFKHNGSYSNFEGECQMCHNPTRSGADSKAIQDHIDFKVRIHAHHANKRSSQDPVTFPEHYGNCAVCHDKGQLKMDGLSAMVATPSTDSVLGPVEFSPIAVTCVSCHGATDALVAHIRTNGGAANDTRGSYVPGSESCATCHGEGKTNGVDAVHPVRW